jgi:hypothetical protein
VIIDYGTIREVWFRQWHRECKADHDEFFFAHGSGVPHPEFEKMLINSASARRRT